MTQWWKLVGLAGVVGVAATGAVVARNERTRRAYTPDEVREQLHRRLAVATSDAAATTTVMPEPESGPREKIAALGRRFRRRGRAR